MLVSSISAKAKAEECTPYVYMRCDDEERRMARVREREREREFCMRNQTNNSRTRRKKIAKAEIKEQNDQDAPG